MRRVNENGVGDMVIGGCAGGTAVLLSMPFDVIKTYLQVIRLLPVWALVGAAPHGASGGMSRACRAGTPRDRPHQHNNMPAPLGPQTQPALLAANTGASAQLSLFCRTGIQMVKARGPGALFVGVVPRLVQQVPSSTLCW